MKEHKISPIIIRKPEVPNGAINMIAPSPFDLDSPNAKIRHKLEYIETVDSSHANYKLSWFDQSDRQLEYLVTLSRDDINKLLDNAGDFIYDLQNAIYIMKIGESLDDEE